jgi:hypothetical protein
MKEKDKKFASNRKIVQSTTFASGASHAVSQRINP